MSTPRRFRPAGRRWVAVFLVLLIVLGMNVVAAAAPAKTMPGITIESPAASTVSGTITVQAQVPGNPSSVQYKIDARTPVKMKKTADGKWSASWDTRTVPYGQHTVMVFASGVNYRPLSATVKVTVDNHNPSVTVLKPAEGATVGGSRVALQVRVNDGIPSTTVTYTAGDGTPAPMTRNQTTGLFEASWDTTTLPDGDVTLSFHSTDATGMTADATRTVTIQQPVGQESGDFTHTRGDLAGRAYTAENLGTNFTSLWRNDWGVHSSRLVIYDGILYAASHTSPGYLSALDTATGKLLWDKRLESTIGPAAVGPNGVYVAIGGDIVAYRPDGTTLWRTAIGAISAPLVTPEGILAGGRDGKVYALDPLTGAPLFTVPTDQTSSYGTGTLPVYAEGVLYLPTDRGIQVVDVVGRQFTGTITTSSDSGLMYHDGNLYVTDYMSLTAFNAMTFEQLWSFQVSDIVITAPAVANNTIVVAAYNKLYAVDAATGEQLWTTTIQGGGNSFGVPTIAGNLIYIGGGYAGGLKIYDLATGAYQTTLLPSEEVRGTVIPYGGVLYIPDGQWGTYALKKQ